MEPIQCVLVGPGTVGSELQRQITEEGWRVANVIDKSDPNDAPPGCRVAFIAMSEQDNGTTALERMMYFLTRGIYVITCAKAALANHCATLAQHMNLIGHSATVGGGTRMLPFLRDRLVGARDVRVRASVNATTNFIFSEMERGRSLPEAVIEARKLGITEPGSDGPESVIRAEALDVLRKTALLFNTVFAQGHYIVADDLRRLISPSTLFTNNLREGVSQRFIVSIGRETEMATEVSMGFATTVDGWSIEGGLRPVHGPAWNWVPSGINNAVRVEEGLLGEKGIFTLSGPGAGPVVTAAAMMTDARHLLNKNVGRS